MSLNSIYKCTRCTYLLHRVVFINLKFLLLSCYVSVTKGIINNSSMSSSKAPDEHKSTDTERRKNT